MEKVHKNLSDEQIERLFAFVRSRFVQHYDVQVELVDHLATAIEEKLADNPEKDCEAALREVYESFGPLGFTRFMESKTGAVRKSAQRKWLQEFLLWFQWPKMVMLLMLIILGYALLQVVQANYFIYGTSIFFLLFYVWFYFSGKRRMKFKKGYSLLILNSQNVVSFNWFFIIGFFPFYAATFFTSDAIPEMFPAWTNWILAIWISLGVFFIISCFIVRNRMLDKLRLMYPEAFLSSDSVI